MIYVKQLLAGLVVLGTIAVMVFAIVIVTYPYFVVGLVILFTALIAWMIGSMLIEKPSKDDNHGV